MAEAFTANPKPPVGTANNENRREDDDGAGKKLAAGETAASASINVDRDNNREVDNAIVDGSTSQISNKSRYHDNKICCRGHRDRY